MKIYLAASMQGGKSNIVDYRGIKDALLEYGEILTEHVVEPIKKDLKDFIIYENDMSNLKIADVLVAEVTAPSLGVGYELAKADERKIPVLCLFNKSSDKQLSCLVSGNPNNKVEYYNTLEEVKIILKKFFENV